MRAGTPYQGERSVCHEDGMSSFRSAEGDWKHGDKEDVWNVGAGSRSTCHATEGKSRAATCAASCGERDKSRERGPGMQKRALLAQIAEIAGERAGSG